MRAGRAGVTAHAMRNKERRKRMKNGEMTKDDELDIMKRFGIERVPSGNSSKKGGKENIPNAHAFVKRTAK
jgi:hypothetical protein